MTRAWKRALAVLVGVAALQIDAAAQCPGPDGLDGGPCCTPAQPSYPMVRNFRQDSFEICWRDCNPEFERVCRAEWTQFASQLTPCKIGMYTLRLKDAAGTIKWRGRIRLQYSRTWAEVDATGQQYQVWRYLANGNLRPTAAAGPMPCPVPPCVTDFGNVHYTGYVDQAENCATGKLEHTWMLTHQCDVIDHAGGFPARRVLPPRPRLHLRRPGRGVRDRPAPARRGRRWSVRGRTTPDRRRDPEPGL